MYEQTIADFGPPQDVVGVFVARPRNPVGSRTLDDAVAGDVIQRSLQIRLTGSSNPIASEQLRPGLRSWVGRTSNRQQRYTVHADGSVTFTLQIGPVREPFQGTDSPVRTNQAMSQHVEGWLAAAAALLAAHAERLGVSGGYMTRCGLIAPPGPITLRVFEGSGDWLLDEEYMTPIHRFVPVDADLDPTTERAEFRSAVAGVALDVINQGGARNLRLLADPS